MKNKLVVLSIFAVLSGCTGSVYGNDINCQKDGSISALYSTINNDKGLYLAVDTDSENIISNQVYRSLLHTLFVLDGLTHLYGIDWAKSSSNPDQYLSHSTIDALCIGNVFLSNYHEFGSKKYESLGGYEDMYKLSMSYQPLYIEILEDNQKLAQKAGMSSITSFGCLDLINKK